MEKDGGKKKHMFKEIIFFIITIVTVFAVSFSFWLWNTDVAKSPEKVDIDSEVADIEDADYGQEKKIEENADGIVKTPIGETASGSYSSDGIKKPELPVEEKKEEIPAQENVIQ